MGQINLTQLRIIIISVGTSSGAPQAGAKTSQDFISA